MEANPRPELFNFHGVSMTRYITRNWENLQNFKARPDDVLLAAFPKSGTTWLSFITDLLHFGQTHPERLASVPIQDRVPFLEGSFYEHSGTDHADHLSTSPRIIKTHLPVQMVPKSFWEQNCKVVYVARNAKDNAVSYFYFAQMNKGQVEPGNWNTFLQNFMDGKVVFGPWYDHVKNWWKKKQTYSNLHYMFYEDLIEDPGKEIDRLCSFVGLSPSAEEKKKILEETSFDKMKENTMVNYITVDRMDHTVSPFMRKGKVGDWKTHFTVAQNQHFDEDYKEKMKDSTIQFRTEVQKKH